MASHPGNDQSRPADVLVNSWDRGRPAAIDLTVTSPLSPTILLEAGLTAEERKHEENVQNSVCLVFHCAWQAAFLHLASQLATGSCYTRSKLINLYGHLKFMHVRAIARAILVSSDPRM